MDLSQTPQSPATRKYAQRITRDQRIQVSWLLKYCLNIAKKYLQVQTLASEGYSRKKISERLEITIAQVRNALKANDVCPKKRSGRHSVLTSTQIDEIEAFVCRSSENRQMSYFELAHNIFQRFGVSERVIARELKKRGYSHRVTCPKPPLSLENRTKRLEFAWDHLHWEKDDWMKVLWSNETWVTDGRHSRTWVTRKVSALQYTSKLNFWFQVYGKD